MSRVAPNNGIVRDGGIKVILRISKYVTISIKDRLLPQIMIRHQNALSVTRKL
jgi:hypothetical protein